MESRVGFMSLVVVFFFILAQLLTPLGANDEVAALIAFKDNIHDPRKVLQSWDSSLTSPCTWFHISCDRNGVTRVDLGYSGLSGTISGQIGNLKYLQYLMLEYNNFYGCLPTGSLANLTNIVRMNFQGNPKLRWCKPDPKKHSHRPPPNQ